MPAVVDPLALTWLPVPHAGQRCGQCQRSGENLFHAMEQTDPTQRPICARCVGQVESEVAERRARKGLRCYGCPETNGLRPVWDELTMTLVWGCSTCRERDRVRMTRRWQRNALGEWCLSEYEGGEFKITIASIFPDPQPGRTGTWGWRTYGANRKGGVQPSLELAQKAAENAL